MDYEIREVRESDLSYLAMNLRADDVRELHASYGTWDIPGVLERSAAHSDECLVGTVDDKPVAIMGIRRNSAPSAVIWAAGTPEITKYRTLFLRNSRALLEHWFLDDPDLRVMYNAVHDNNTVHKRWLSWVGARIFPAVPYGVMGEPFAPFEIRRYHHV